MADKQILVLGSTNRKLATFSGDKIKTIKKGSCNQDDLRNLELAELETLILSVRPDLESQAKEKITKSVFFDKEQAAIKFSIRGLYKEFGADRLANIIGASSIAPKSSIAVLDFGTCNTLSVINWVDKGNLYEYKNGFICPGLNSSLFYIQDKTTALPKITELEFMEYALKWRPDKVANSAKESIFIGIIWQSLLLVNHALGTLNSLNKPAKLFLTGGWAIAIQSCFGRVSPEERPTIEPNLGLIGGNEYLKVLRN